MPEEDLMTTNDYSNGMVTPPLRSTFSHPRAKMDKFSAQGNQRAIGWFRALVTAVVLYMVQIGHANGEVIYRETFGSTSGYPKFSTFGWTFLASSQSGSYPNQVDGPVENSDNITNRGNISSGTGKPSDLDNVNAGPSASMTNGYAIIKSTSNSDSGGVKALLYTDEWPIDRNAYSIDSFQFYSLGGSYANTAFIGTISVAIRINGNWYITTPQAPDYYDNTQITSSTFLEKAVLMTIDFASATWHTLEATIGQPFSIGSTVILPDGSIEAFGVYVNTGIINKNLGMIAIDTFTVNATAIPEPKFASLWLAAALAATLCRQFKYRHDQ